MKFKTTIYLQTEKRINYADDLGKEIKRLQKIKERNKSFVWATIEFHMGENKWKEVYYLAGYVQSFR